VYGNLLAVLCELADGPAARRTLKALMRARVSEPWPVRVVCEPILEESALWRPYMSRHRQNYAWQYHNGGIWPFVGGFWVTALAEQGARAAAKRELEKLALVNALDGWAFNEWLHGQTAKAGGMRGQSWNAAAYLMAYRAVETRARVFSRLDGTRSARPGAPE